MPPPAVARKHVPKIKVEKPVPGKLDVPQAAPLGDIDDVDYLIAWAKEHRPEKYAEVQAMLHWKPPQHVSFLEFSRRTVTFKLDPWQEHLCERLGRLDKEKGQRIAIHAGPQLGKSVFVSQRLPAWYIGVHPTDRVRLACYNIEHATRFGGIVRDLLKGADFKKMFPSAGLKLPAVCSAEEWTTAARTSLQDSQASFKALGLLTGFVGSGADLLIIDDPYASPLDAYSSLVREKVWTFWSEAAAPRLSPDCNVVVMFHRYHQHDLAGRLLQEGGWEVLRYAAQADGEEDCMPPGRPIGAFLSPRFPAKWWEGQQENKVTWLAQFQGRPTPKEGAFFDETKITEATGVPAGVQKCRAWDLASTMGGGDWTVGALLAGPDETGLWYVCDIIRGRWDTFERNRRMRQAAEADGITTAIRLNRDPAQAGVDQAHGLISMLSGYRVKAVVESGAKDVRADAFSSQVNAGNVRILPGAWNLPYRMELATFTGRPGETDDQVDASASAFNELTHRRKARIA